MALHSLMALLILIGGSAYAAVLPEDRADALYHSYDGGGVTIDGPSILVRKSVADTVSLYGNYYVDMVSSASIDVLVSGASRYTEQRTETSAGLDYLHDRTIMSLGYTHSSERDYEADTVSFGLSQEFFGDMTTLSMGYVFGDDTVRKSGSPDFEESLQRRRFNVGLSQVLTKNWIVALSTEAIVDEGFLNNPYRFVRYADNSSSKGWSTQPEQYPRTRNSDAYALRSIYSLPSRAAVRGEIRTFNDSWGIKADTVELRYVHPWQKSWIFEAKLRYYSQTQANFYADLFPYEDAQNFMARDKELSTFDSSNAGIGITYNFKPSWWYFKKSSANLYWDFMRFEYDNFRDARYTIDDGHAPGEEPLYTFDANVVRLFFSFYY